MLQTGVILICFYLFPVANIEEHTYHHCYQEGGSCGINNITCYNNTVIDIMWSRVGYSEYWMWDGYRRNCSVTDDKCEMEIDEPSMNCSGLSLCYLYTCSESTYQRIDCDGLKATNYMRLNYTCIKGKSCSELILCDRLYVAITDFVPLSFYHYLKT